MNAPLGDRLEFLNHYPRASIVFCLFSYVPILSQERYFPVDRTL